MKSPFNKRFYILGTPLIIMSAILISGCSWKANMRCPMGGGLDKCTGEISVSGSTSFAPEGSAGYKMSIGGSAIDVAQLHLHIDTTNVALTTTHGQFLMVLKRNGATIASRRFNFYRSGSNLYPSDPGVIQAWTNNFPTADDVYIKTSPLDVQRTTSGGATGTLSLSTVYQGETKATSSASYYYEPCILRTSAKSQLGTGAGFQRIPRC
ncbi:MAG TPA: hypothetical protein VFK45_00470 [Gammaproteobacteria bacterium]|nr:hypothetical protein [Gammaproteobacteria bacterium]